MRFFLIPINGEYIESTDFTTIGENKGNIAECAERYSKISTPEMFCGLERTLA